VIHFVNHFSPSTNLVLKIILEKKQITPINILLETSLPKKTVNNVIRILKECNVIKTQHNMNDLRRKYYTCMYCPKEYHEDKLSE